MLKDQMLLERNISAEAMARHSKSFRFGNASYRTSSRTNKLRILGGQKKVGLRRRTDGHKKFRRSVWNVQAAVGTPEFIAEERRVSAQWSQLAEEEKALWEAESRSEDTTLLSLPANANMKDVGAAVAGGSSHGREMALRREAVASALGAMSSHHAWDNGLGLCSMSSALKPEYVTNDSIVTCRGFVKATFGYDGTIVENPNVDTSLRLPFAIRNWGLCSKDSLLKACRLGSENIYKQLQSTGIGRGQLPIIAKLSVLGECVYVVITDTVGKGETVLAAFLDFGDEAWSLQQVAGARGSAEPRCAFSQQQRARLIRPKFLAWLRASSIQCLFLWVASLPFGLVRKHFAIFPWTLQFLRRRHPRPRHMAALQGGHWAWCARLSQMLH